MNAVRKRGRGQAVWLMMVERTGGQMDHGS